MREFEITKSTHYIVPESFCAFLFHLIILLLSLCFRLLVSRRVHVYFSFFLYPFAPVFCSCFFLLVFVLLSLSSFSCHYIFVFVKDEDKTTRAKYKGKRMKGKRKGCVYTSKDKNTETKRRRKKDKGKMIRGKRKAQKD